MEPTLDHINRLSAERSRLYQLAANGRRADPELRWRIREVGAELERLWEQRRQERAGRREGIDLLVDQIYQHAYGARYEDAVAPPPVAEAEDEVAAVRAA